MIFYSKLLTLTNPEKITFSFWKNQVFKKKPRKFGVFVKTAFYMSKGTFPVELLFSEKLVFYHSRTLSE